VTDFDAIDVFAGPGGWDVAADLLGLRVLGVEIDDAACATREAAGHATLRADVALLDPRDHQARGLIGSPPCPTFSAAGNGAGRALTAILVGCANALADGRDTRAETRAEALRILLARKRPPKTTPEKWQARCERDAAMSVLVVEPLRWALANRPEWIALEQVPPVLGLWRAFAAILEREGYRCWAGILEAERYGVPQTRERAFLLARSDGQPHPPAPTHQRYVPGEAQRRDVTLEGEIRPWVSMAEALGWHDADRMRSNYNDGSTGERGEREGDEPAFVVTGKFDRNFRLRANAQANAAERDAADPAQSGSQQEGAIRVTVQEAAILQGFPPDYPWRGSRTAQFQQIGNAVPPPLALAVLAALLGVDVEPIAGGESGADGVVRTNNFTAVARDLDGRPIGAPAPTVDGKVDAWKVEGGAPTHLDVRQVGAKLRPTSQPAPTMLAEGLAKGVPVWRRDDG
jgi:DNA (cytosine-5)-methyltransferase 1